MTDFKTEKSTEHADGRTGSGLGKEWMLLSEEESLGADGWGQMTAALLWPRMSGGSG